MSEPTVRFSAGGPEVAPLGMGASSWGNPVWGMGTYDQDLSEVTIAEALDASIAAGVALIDTAAGYGNGESERIIGRLLAADPERQKRVIIASKFMPMPWKLDVRVALRRSLEGSLDRLGLDSVELYQIHGPISLRSHKVLAAALASAVKDGLAQAVGVCNFSVKEMTQMQRALGEHDAVAREHQRALDRDGGALDGHAEEMARVVEGFPGKLVVEGADAQAAVGLDLDGADERDTAQGGVHAEARLGPGQGLMGDQDLELTRR